MGRQTVNRCTGASTSRATLHTADLGHRPRHCACKHSKHKQIALPVRKERQSRRHTLMAGLAVLRRLISVSRTPRQFTAVRLTETSPGTKAGLTRRFSSPSQALPWGRCVHRGVPCCVDSTRHWGRLRSGGAHRSEPPRSPASQTYIPSPLPVHPYAARFVDRSLRRVPT